MTRVVMLHGAFGVPHDWHEVVGLAGARGASLPFVPGHDDDAAAWGAVCVEDLWREAVERLAAALPTGPLVLGGYSLGARLALALALRERARVAGVFLVSGTAGHEGDSAETAARRALDDERARWLERDAAGFLEHFWSMPMFAGIDPHPRRAALLAERTARASRTPAALAHVLLGLSVAHMPPMWRELTSLRCPVLAVSGAADLTYAKAAGRIAAAAVAGRHLSVPGAGHSLLLEAPHAVGAALAGMLASLPERRTAC